MTVRIGEDRGRPVGPRSRVGLRASAGAALLVLPLLAGPPPVTAQTADPGPAVVDIDAGTCRRLVRHVPDPDVTYRPGVDVRGRSVAPADLHDYSAFEALVPDTVTFHVVLDPFEATRVVPPRGIESPGMVLGTVGYDINRGTFTINGRPVTTGQEDALLAACRRGLTGQAGPDGGVYPEGYGGPRLPGQKPVP